MEAPSSQYIIQSNRSRRSFLRCNRCYPHPHPRIRNGAISEFSPWCGRGSATSVYSTWDWAALTQLVAERLGNKQVQDIPALVWTALFLMLVLGLAGTIVIYILSPWLTQGVLKIPEALQSETLRVFNLLALSIPVVITTAALRGVLEAKQRFDLTNIVRIPMGIYNFAAPLLVLPFSHSLFPVLIVLVIGRVIAWFIHIYLCFVVMPELRPGIILSYALIKPLISFGSWITISNVVNPIMNILDRFLIGALVSLNAVTFYVTPYEMITKLTMIPGAVTSVFFPAFAPPLPRTRTRLRCSSFEVSSFFIWFYFLL